jgi:GTP-binding protein EngB required for normal cell division
MWTKSIGADDTRETLTTGAQTTAQAQAPTVSSGTLRDYGRLKLDLAGIIRSLRQVAVDRKDNDASNECRKLLSRLAEDRFNLVVVGQFSRGKTSLMNAMLGVDRLPTSVLPLTSVITSVSYGDRERVLIHWHWWSYTTEIPLNELPQYVTQQGNPGNQRRVRCAEVQLPVELLRLGFYFIDTPGVGSAIAANTATTSEFLPEADAVIFLTSFESPLAEAELQFLDQVRRHVRKIFLVVNKRDLVPAEQQDGVIAFVEARLKDAFEEQRPRVYSLSARDALNAKQNGDPEALRRSGLPNLEADLLDFLQKDKTREFLRRITSRASAILSRLGVQFDTIRALSADEAKVKAFEADLRRQMNTLCHEREKISRDLGNRLGFDLHCHFERELEQPVMDFGAAMEQKVRERLNSHDLFADSLESQLAADADAARQRVSAAWFDHHKQEIQHLVEDAGRNALAQIKDDITQFNGIGTAAAGDPWQDPSVEGRLTDILRDNPVALRSSLPGSPPFEIPWWIELLAAFSPTRPAIVRWCLRKTKEIIAAYRAELASLLTKAAEDWVEHLDRRVAEFIEDSATARRQMLAKQVRPEDLSNLERLRERLEAVLSVVDLIELGTTGIGAPGTAELNDVPQSDVAARCDICREAETALFEFMRRRQYELSTSEKDQISHAEQGGFCGLHTWQYEAISSPQGVCSAYPPVLSALGRRLRALAQSAASPGALVDGVLRLIPNSGTCRACQLVASVERRGATKLLAALTAEEKSGSAPLPPLCMRHLYSLLRSKPSPEIARRLVEEQARLVDRLSEDMQRYAIKHDALRRELATELEHRVHEIALARLVGLRSIVAPWNVGEI